VQSKSRRNHKVCWKSWLQGWLGLWTLVTSWGCIWAQYSGFSLGAIN
jgi:hypothetical protein